MSLGLLTIHGLFSPGMNGDEKRDKKKTVLLSANVRYSPAVFHE